jgi:hypothetical protein
MKNNIVYVTGQYAVETFNVPLAFDIDYNCYYRSDAGNKFNWGGVVKSFAEWQALGMDVNGLYDDPDLVDITDPTYDLHLQITSPCKTAGVTIAGLPLFDYEGNAVSPTTPSIGAYEYH